MRTTFLLPLLAVVPAFSGCGVAGSMFGGDDDGPCVPDSSGTGAIFEDEQPEPGGIHPFTSQQEFDAYVAEIDERAKARAASMRASAKCAGASSEDSAPAAAYQDSAAPTAGSATNENVTNNQEAGVDEGGIVKNVGDALVVLRKGRLFVVDVGPEKQPTVSDSLRVAPTEEMNGNVWYDEMLVKGDLVYVVGYRYGLPTGSEARGATEVDSFRIVAGRLVRLKSLLLESNDYYSGKNYASRMVDGKLVFYMPQQVASSPTGQLRIPRVLEARADGSVTPVGPIFGVLDLHTSLVKPTHPTFHTVVRCELPTSGEMHCHGRSVLGNWWREHYVSPDAVYVWSHSHVYRFDFKSLEVVAHKAEGMPNDQFSFRQGESDLFVATNGYDRKTRAAGANPKLLALPLAAFDKRGDQSAVPSRSLGEQRFLVKNRFIGDVLVAALSSATNHPYYGGWSGGASVATSDVVAIHTKTGATSKSAVPSAVVRIEPLGSGRALIVAQGPTGMTLDAYGVDDLGKSLGNLTLEGVSEGEGRSHGFFYKPGAEGAGQFGYAVVAPPSGSASWGWGNGISNIGFFDVAHGGALAARGIVSSGTDASQCETSCTDWYGNTRPIFLGSRVFALMGGELAEVSFASGVAQKAGAAPLTWTEQR